MFENLAKLLDHDSSWLPHPKPAHEGISRKTNQLSKRPRHAKVRAKNRLAKQKRKLNRKPKKWKRSTIRLK